MDFVCRPAQINDVPMIVRMLADDFLGQQREALTDPLPESYLRAFRELEADPNNELVVADLEGGVVGTMQLTFTPSLSYQGGRRCTVESVRVDGRLRGKGIGREMMLWAIERAKERGLRFDATRDAQGPHRRTPLLRIARLFQIAHRNETEAVTA